jgi:hypothetical protein
MRDRINRTIAVVGAIVWRGFGIFLFIVGGAAGSGAIITGDPLMGISIAWATLMLGVIGAVGYAIATTGSADESVVAKAVQDAVQKHAEEKGIPTPEVKKDESPL